MLPVSPVFPDALYLSETIYAEDQPQYMPLPAHRTSDGHAVTRWRLTWRERLRVLLSGNLWLTIATFGQPLQPVMLEATAPKL